MHVILPWNGSSQGFSDRTPSNEAEALMIKTLGEPTYYTMVYTKRWDLGIPELGETPNLRTHVLLMFGAMNMLLGHPIGIAVVDCITSQDVSYKEMMNVLYKLIIVHDIPETLAIHGDITATDPNQKQKKKQQHAELPSLLEALHEKLPIHNRDELLEMLLLYEHRFELPSSESIFFLLASLVKLADIVSDIYDASYVMGYLSTHKEASRDLFDRSNYMTYRRLSEAVDQVLKALVLNRFDPSEELLHQIQELIYHLTAKAGGMQIIQEK